MFTEIIGNHFISAHLFGISEIILELITQILPDHIVFWISSWQIVTIKRYRLVVQILHE